MKGHKKSFISGFLLALILMCGVSMVTGSGASASNGKKAVTISYKDIKICIDGQYITPKDANGNTVEPFILNGTTYLPVRAVGEAFGKAVDYDGKTHTVYVGAKPSGGGAAGTRSDPLNGSAGVTVTYAPFSDSKQFKLKVLNTITGDGANYLATKTSSGGRALPSNQEWLFFEVELNYISSSKGEDDSIKPYLGILNHNYFFKPDGTELPLDYAWMNSTDMRAYDHTKTVMPGSTSTLLVPLLVNKGYDKVLLQVPNGQTNTWVHMNGGSTITTVDGVKSHFNIDQGSASTPSPAPTPEPTATPDPTPSVPSDPKEILSFIRFGKEYGPFTMKNYKDSGYTDTKPATTNSVTSLVFTDAGTYGPIGGYPVTMRIKGTSEADSICFWLQAYDADGNRLCNRIVTVSDGITAGQPYDVTVTSSLDLAAPGNSIWNTTNDPFNAPSKVARIALMGGTSRQRDFVYFDTNGNQVDG